MNVHTNPVHAHAGRHGTGMHMHDCISTCLRAHQECSETLQYCIQRGGEHVDPHHLKLMQSCIEICSTSARFMMLQSPYHQVLCEVCAQICRSNAKDCAAMNDETMNRCAEVCMECAESCEKMLEDRV